MNHVSPMFCTSTFDILGDSVSVSSSALAQVKKKIDNRNTTPRRYTARFMEDHLYGKYKRYFIKMFGLISKEGFDYL